MWASRIYLVVAIVGFFGAVTALRRPNTHRHPLRRPNWLLATFTAELIPLRMIVGGVLLALFWWLGALDRSAGRIALVLVLVTWALYVVVLAVSYRARKAIGEALHRAGFTPPAALRFDWWRLVSGDAFSLPRAIERLPDLEYAPGLELDVYRRRGHEGVAPALIQIHGGGWRGGNRRQQARPLIHHMARNGWVVFSVSYPLAPDATFPEPLTALKRAVVWVKEHGPEYGADPNRVFVTGGSAGGHLAALVALTPGSHQPGFEEMDTSVNGAVTLYGIYDFFNRSATRDDWPLIPGAVMKKTSVEDPDAYRDASPLDQVGPHAPPFLVIHGTHDSLVPRAESEQFVDALDAVSATTVAYAAIPGANHAFDIIPSLRTQIVVAGIAAMLDELAITRRPGPRRDEPPADTPPHSSGRRGPLSA